MGSDLDTTATVRERPGPQFTSNGQHKICLKTRSPNQSSHSSQSQRYHKIAEHAEANFSQPVCTGRERSSGDGFRDRQGSEMGNYPSKRSKTSQGALESITQRKSSARSINRITYS